MSTEENGQTQRYVFKARFGAVSPSAPAQEEPSHDEINAFVNEILGLATDRQKQDSGR